MKYLLKMMDLSTEDIIILLDLADQLKYEQKHGIEHTYLKGKTLGLIFEKASTRTRVSFEVGMTQLGGYPLYLSSSDLQIGRGEPTQDTARVLSRYVDGIMIRTFHQQTVEDFAKYGSIPIINGLTDDAHPCQVLADLMTIREYKQNLSGNKLCYIGDGNNMANSLIVGGLKTGMQVSVCVPKGYEPHEEVLAFAKAYGENFTLCHDPKEAAQGADVLYTDVWVSMGEGEKNMKDFEDFQINKEILSLAKEDCIVLHCLPAHREEEITSEVFETHANEIFNQAENRLHAQKAVMVKLMEK